jgi:hypothetical protein
MLVSEAVAKIQAEGGADSSSSATTVATIRGWVNECVSDAIGRSTWRQCDARSRADGGGPGPVRDRRRHCGRDAAAGRDGHPGAQDQRRGSVGDSGRCRGIWSGWRRRSRPRSRTTPIRRWSSTRRPRRDGDVDLCGGGRGPGDAGATADAIPLPADIVNRVAVDGPIGDLVLAGWRSSRRRRSRSRTGSRRRCRSLSRRANSRTSSGRSSGEDLARSLLMLKLLAQENFGAGMVAGLAADRIPFTAAESIKDALLDENGNPYRRVRRGLPGRQRDGGRRPARRGVDVGSGELAGGAADAGGHDVMRLYVLLDDAWVRGRAFTHGVPGPVSSAKINGLLFIGGSGSSTAGRRGPSPGHNDAGSITRRGLLRHPGR